MSTGMKVLVLVWLFMLARFFGALLAARHCMRLRNESMNKPTYELLTAIGVGMFLLGISDVLLIWNGIANVSPVVANQLSGTYLAMSFSFEMVRTIGIWVITLIIMNGGAPGQFRKGIFWVLRTFRIMRAA